MTNFSLDFSQNDYQPLAARMRPGTLEQYIGQTHLLAEGKPLPRAIRAGQLHSMILWGPPGTGKTTLAEVIGHYADADIERLSAVTSGVKEIREAIERARQNRNLGRRTILFVDEHFCRILRMVQSPLSVPPPKTRHLNSTPHCYPAPVFICSNPCHRKISKRF